MKNLVENVHFPGELSGKYRYFSQYHFEFRRYRLSEISFVLKALTTLIISMKKSSAVKGAYGYINSEFERR